MATARVRCEMSWFIDRYKKCGNNGKLTCKHCGKTFCGTHFKKDCWTRFENDKRHSPHEV